MGIRVSFSEKIAVFYPFEETNEIDLTYYVYPYLSSVFKELGLNRICGIIGGGEQIVSLSYRHAKDVLGIDVNLIQVALFYLKLFPERRRKIEKVFFNKKILSLVPPEDLERLCGKKKDVRYVFKQLGKSCIDRLEYRGWKEYFIDMARRSCSGECNLEMLVSDLFEVETERIGEYDVLYLSSMCEVEEARKRGRNWLREIMEYVKKGDLILIEASLYPTTTPLFQDLGKFEHVAFRFPEDRRGMSECAYVVGSKDVLKKLSDVEIRAPQAGEGIRLRVELH